MSEYKIRISSTLILAIALFTISLGSVIAEAVEATCAYVPYTSGLYLCDKILANDMHIKIDHAGGICHGNTSNVTDILVNVDITEDISNCPWDVGTKIDIMWRTAGNHNCGGGHLYSPTGSGPGGHRSCR